MRPRPGGGLVSHRMDDHPSGPLAVPPPDLDAIDEFSPRPPRRGEPHTSPVGAPRPRSARRHAGLWLLPLALLAGAAGLLVWPADRSPPPQTERSRASGPMPVG